MDGDLRGAVGRVHSKIAEVVAAPEDGARRSPSTFGRAAFVDLEQHFGLGGGRKEGQKLLSPKRHRIVVLSDPALVNTPLQPIAVIDGTLCQLTRHGSRAAAHTPLATAVVEFSRGPLCCFVREHPYGLLPGMPNLYCLDANLRLLWLAEWPLENDPCAALGDFDERKNVLTVTSISGTIVRLDASTGRLLKVMAPVAVAS